ncbi:hypothetical protein LJC20_03900 [Eubacteriales bacterium OttesenSCG-928-M02]|nr:hypothetical protein [Eubacteriales bacterium OttesenSCG-928-M02]
MSIFELMDLLEDEIENSPNVPLANKKRVDLDRFYEIMDQMREEIPEEIRKAELLLREKQFILDDAHEQAENTIREAERRAKQLIEDHTITQQAQRYGEELVANAQNNSKEIRLSARAYADDVLGDLEGYVREYHELIRKNRDSLGAKARDNLNSAQAPRQTAPDRDNTRDARDAREREDAPRPDKKEGRRLWGKSRNQQSDDGYNDDYDDWDDDMRD